MAVSGPSTKPPDDDGSASIKPGKTFVVVVSSKSAFEDGASDVGVVSTYPGELALRLTHQEMLSLAEPFQNVLVGQFVYSNRPWRLLEIFL